VAAAPSTAGSLKLKRDDTAPKTPRERKTPTREKHSASKLTDAKAKRSKTSKPSTAVKPYTMSSITDLLVYRTKHHPEFKGYYDFTKEGFALEEGWTSTKGKFGALGGSCPLTIVGVDCEMVETTTEKNALARITLINLTPSTAGQQPGNYQVLLDRIVHPADRVVTDLRTTISGIKQSDLASEDRFHSVKAAQDAVKELVSENCIIVGHGLNHDLLSLKLAHARVIDTALVFSSPLKHQLLGLKDLVLHFFQSDCQPENKPHDSITDALWALELIRDVVDKCTAEGYAGMNQQDRMACAERHTSMPLPDHFKRRVQVFQLCEGVTLQDVTSALGVPRDCKFLSREINYRSKNGKPPLGSVMLKFFVEEHATKVFQALGQDGMKTDRDGLFQKKVFLDKAKFPTARHFFCKAYCSPGEAAAPVPAAATTPATPQAAVAAVAAVAAFSPGEVKFCPSCGTKKVPGMKFCGSCGMKLG